MTHDLTPHPQGAAVICDHNSQVLRVVSDELGIFDSSDSEDLVSVVDDGSVEKLTDFLQRVQTHKSSMGWELNTITSAGVRPLYYFGVRHDEGVLVVISPMPENLVHLYDQMISIVNEQNVLLRECQQKLSMGLGSSEDPAQLDSIMQLNNELVNAQRELSIRNILLKRQKERAAKLFELNPDALLIIDDSGTIITGNGAAQRLFETDEDGLSELRMKFPLGQDGDVETCVQTATGAKVMEIRSTETEWDSRPVTLVSLRDVTQRKELEELKEDVARISQHDLKSPLGGVVSLSQLLKTHEDPDVREAGELVEDAGSRLLNMVNGSLTLYRMERGEYVPEMQDVEIASVVRGVIADCEGLRQGKRLEVVQVGRCDELPGEPSLYHNMLSNLVKNAFEAAPAGSTVTIRWGGSPDEGYRLSVHNYGAVPAAVRESFFEKYATHGKRDGSGLGTYSARLTALTLGGSLGLRTSEQEGTTLLFSIEAG